VQNKPHHQRFLYLASHRIPSSDFLSVHSSHFGAALIRIRRRSSYACWQARIKIQTICYRLIGEAKQHLQSEAAADASAEDDGGKTATNGDSAAAGSGQPPRRRVGSLPPGGFISHLLSTDNKLIGRKFTDFEVRRNLF